MSTRVYTYTLAGTCGEQCWLLAGPSGRWIKAHDRRHAIATLAGQRSKTLPRVDRRPVVKSPRAVGHFIGTGEEATALWQEPIGKLQSRKCWKPSKKRCIVLLTGGSPAAADGRGGRAVSHPTWG